MTPHLPEYFYRSSRLCLMLRRPPRSTRTDTLFPYTTLFRSFLDACKHARRGIDHPAKLIPYIVRESEEYARHLKSRLWEEENRWRNRLFRRSEEHTSELQSLMRTSYAVFCSKKQTTRQHKNQIGILNLPYRLHTLRKTH